jgi:hypothetical protein
VREWLRRDPSIPLFPPSSAKSTNDTHFPGLTAVLISSGLGTPVAAAHLATRKSFVVIVTVRQASSDPSRVFSRPAGLASDLYRVRASRAEKVAAVAVPIAVAYIVEAITHVDGHNPTLAGLAFSDLLPTASRRTGNPAYVPPSRAADNALDRVGSTESSHRRARPLIPSHPASGGTESGSFRHDARARHRGGRRARRRTRRLLAICGGDADLFASRLRNWRELIDLASVNANARLGARARAGRRTTMPSWKRTAMQSSGNEATDVSAADRRAYDFTARRGRDVPLKQIRNESSCGCASTALRRDPLTVVRQPNAPGRARDG